MTSIEEQVCIVLRGESAVLPSGAAGERLLEAAREHDVEGLVAWRTGRLDASARAQIVLDELRVRELNRVLAALEARGLAPVVFKGAALAHTHYPDSWLRPRGDADVLVSPAGRERAADCLGALGYEARPVVAGTLVSFQAPFARRDAHGVAHVVDLHWRVANPQAVANVLTHGELAAGASAVEVRGQLVRVPSPPDALLLACVHRAAHHDDSDALLWLYDIHLLASGMTPAEWTAFVARAAERGVAPLCARGLGLARRRLATDVPSGVRVALSTEDAGAAAVFLAPGRRRARHLLSDLAALGPGAGIRLLWEHACPPAAYVLAKYGARHRVLLPGLYLWRLLRGVPKWLARPARGAGAGAQASAVRYDP